MMSVTSSLSREQAIARILELTGRPEANGEHPWLVLLVGLPGSGKSTFARKLAKATGALVLESDSLRAALFARPTHEPEENRRLFDAIYDAATSLLRDGANVIVDATNLRERDRERAYLAAETVGAETLVLHLRAPEPVVRQRLTGRASGSDPEDRSSAGPAIYAKLAESEEPIRRAHWTIDTSDAEATESALRRAIETLNRSTIAAIGRHTGGSIS